MSFVGKNFLFPRQENSDCYSIDVGGRGGAGGHRRAAWRPVSALPLPDLEDTAGSGQVEPEGKSWACA